MKKTMFITSVIMVVVMAIALTTSSLAWFTAAGSSSVSTAALQISAKANASSGLQISTASSDGAWYPTVNLENTGNSNMIPADMYLGASVDDYDGTGSVHAAATVLDALVGEKFINNKIDSNGNFDGTAVTANTSEEHLYYTDTVWISSVDSQNAKNVQASIEFTTDGTTAYTNISSDPILYVAVLAAKEDSVKPDRSTAAEYRDWEILAIFNSGSQTTVRLGTNAAAYADGEVVANRGTTPPISLLENTSKTTTVPLGAITTSGGVLQAYGSSREFKIVAWYDGASLVNANSNFSLYFTLTFTAVAVGA